MTELNMPLRKDEENLINYSTKLEAYAQLLESRVKCIRNRLYLLNDAQYNIDKLIDKIEENVR